MNISNTVQFTIWIGGEIDDAKRWLRSFCYGRGFCVTVDPTTFIYTGGEEAGVRIGIENYPRFPMTTTELQAIALEIANGLIVALCQKTALVVGAGSTRWIAIDPPGLRKP